MSYGYTPQALPRIVQASQLLPFGVGNAKIRKCRAGVGCSVAVDVEIGKAGSDGEDLDDQTIRGGDPLGLLPVVISCGYHHAYRKTNEVLNVHKYRLIESEAKLAQQHALEAYGTATNLAALSSRRIESLLTRN